MTLLNTAFASEVTTEQPQNGITRRQQVGVNLLTFGIVGTVGNSLTLGNFSIQHKLSLMEDRGPRHLEGRIAYTGLTVGFAASTFVGANLFVDDLDYNFGQRVGFNFYVGSVLGFAEMVRWVALAQAKNGFENPNDTFSSAESHARGLAVYENQRRLNMIGGGVTLTTVTVGTALMVLCNKKDKNDNGLSITPMIGGASGVQLVVTRL